MSTAQRLGPRAQRTRAAILAAAEAVFAEKGFAAARLEDVAAQVEIRRASLVYYFRDKRALYEAVLEDLFGELLVRYQVVLDGPGSIARKLEDTMRVWLEYLGERPGLCRIVLREAAESSPAVSAVLADRIRPLVQGVFNLLVDGKQRGLFDPVDPLRLVLTMAGTTIFYDTFAHVLNPARTFGPTEASNSASHITEVLKVMRRLVGTRPLRAVPSRNAGGRRRLT